MTEDEKQKLRAEVEKAARDSAIASYTQKKLLEEHPDLSKEQKAALNNASNEYYKISQDKINSVKKTDKPFYDELRMLNAAEQGSVLMELQAGGNKFGNELSAITNKLSGVIGNTNKTVADTNQYRPELFPAKPAPQDVKSDSQPPAIKLADENPKSTLKEDDFTTQLKRALLRSAIASRVLDEVTEKHPEILNVEPDKRLLLQTLGINEHAQVFNQIDSKLSDGKLITQAELLERMAGTPEQRKKYSEESKKISPKEDFSRGSPEYLKEIYAQIDSGMHDAEITALRGEVNKKIGAKYVGKLIDAARKELQEVAIGNVESDKLTKILGRLEKNHDLGPEVLDPAYDYKNNTDTGKRDKTAEKMQKRVNYSIESGDALMKAHAALNGIRSGEVDAKEGIMIINDQLSKYGFGYDRLDKAFDPFNPHMPHRTVDEMKWEIKSAVTRGNNERVEHIKAGKNYNKPDYNLDLKEMLSVKEDKAKAEEVFSKVSGKINRTAKVVPETVAVEQNTSAKQSTESGNKGSGETPAISKEERPINALEQMLNRRKQELEKESKPTLSAPAKDNTEPKVIDEKLVKHLQGKMLNDEIRLHVWRETIKKHPDLPSDKRSILDTTLLKQDFSGIAINTEKGISSTQGIGEQAFFDAFFTAKARISEEIGKGDKSVYYKKISELKEKTNKEILDDVLLKPVKEVRKSFDQVASGHYSSFSLRRKLEEYGLGMEVLDPKYDPKNPNTPHKTSGEMEKTLTPLFAKADALYEARKALHEMEVGKIDLKSSIENINKHLASAELGYDALDEKFDLRKPDAKHKTSKQMKEEIKSAAHKGDAAADEQRKYAIERNRNLNENGGAPDHMYHFVPSKPEKLDLDKLLNLPEGKKTSANPADEKFAALMDGVKVNPSIILASNVGLVYPNVPRNGQGRAIEV